MHSRQIQRVHCWAQCVHCIRPVIVGLAYSRRHPISGATCCAVKHSAEQAIVSPHGHAIEDVRVSCNRVQYNA